MFLVANENKVEDTLNFWGERLYPIMACEEMGELIQAISKMERGQDKKDLLEEEIRDVFIALCGLIKIYDVNVTKINDMIEEKLNSDKRK